MGIFSSLFGKSGGQSGIKMAGQWENDFSPMRRPGMTGMDALGRIGNALSSFQGSQPMQRQGVDQLDEERKKRHERIMQLLQQFGGM